MRSEPINLIVGSDSFIGGALMAQLQRVGKQVVGTTRRSECVDECHIYLDILEDVETWSCPWSVAVAVICAGVTKLEACRRDPLTSARVNVERISALVKNLVAKGAFVVYLSTNQVFDGSVPHRLPNDPLSPVTEYGRQKAEAERRISQWKDSVSILRLSKVFGKEVPLFREWVLKLRQQKLIHPFQDMAMAPVPASTVVTVIQLIVENRVNGIMQVSGNRDVSYAEAAILGTKSLGFDKGLIQPINSTEGGDFQERLPKYTTMDMRHLRNIFGIEPPDVEWTIKTNFADIVSSP